MAVAEMIRSKLREAFDLLALEVKDESYLHKGHSGAPEGGESHFRVHVVSKAFEGMNRVARQRAVNAVLKDLLAGPIHALAMKTLTPEEAEKE
ncbi:MAG: BolA family protein [Amphiplicatus sp.]